MAISAAALVLGSCDGGRAQGADAGGSKRDIILLFGSDPGALAPKLPSYAALRSLADGSTASYADRLSAVIPTAASAGTAPFVVAMRPKKGLVDMAFKAQAAGRPIDWILVSPADDPLACEAVADLVVDIDPSQSVDADFESALERGLCELARRVATGKAHADDEAEITAALRSAGGWEWKVVYRVDPATGVKAKNHVIVSAKPRS
ncbi:MAG: hypothetical protein M0001_09610 [Treponema sp.]|nr:hypothetical protein [Treponema sp.]